LQGSRRPLLRNGTANRCFAEGSHCRDQIADRSFDCYQRGEVLKTNLYVPELKIHSEWIKDFYHLRYESILNRVVWKALSQASVRL
jgi:hypothetical protein